MSTTWPNKLDCFGLNIECSQDNISTSVHNDSRVNFKIYAITDPSPLLNVLREYVKCLKVKNWGKKTMANGKTHREINYHLGNWRLPYLKTFDLYMKTLSAGDIGQVSSFLEDWAMLCTTCFTKEYVWLEFNAWSNFYLRMICMLKCVGKMKKFTRHNNQANPELECQKTRGPNFSNFRIF